MPPAMADPSTYASTRLRDIKADPDTWADVWRWRGEFDAAQTPRLQREVLGLARQIGADSHLAVLAQAFASSDAEVRFDAAHSLALLPEDRMRDGFALGFAASDPETRADVLSIIPQLQPHLRAALLETALAAGASDVQARAIEMLSQHPSPPFFSALIQGLRTVSSENRPALDDAIEEIVQEKFSTFEQGRRWWEENRGHYDDLMSLIPQASE
jgi:hypothetical protein